MFDISWGRSFRNCAGVSRRDALKVGALAAGGLTMADLLRAESAAAEAGKQIKRKSVICFWLDGGPTNHETWTRNPKPPANTGDHLVPFPRAYRELSCANSSHEQHR